MAARLPPLRSEGPGFDCGCEPPKDLRMSTLKDQCGHTRKRRLPEPAHFCSVLLFSLNVARLGQFFQEALGMVIQSSGPTHMTLASASWSDRHGVTIYIKHAETVSQATHGYSPMINFSVVNLEETLSTMLSLGADLDGGVQDLPTGKVASVRMPEGQMVGLVEFPRSVSLCGAPES
mmetsp:Transcript_42937/g.93263  ORF Transcript_42937/g.93263 Transcript_42937/m.93263 type:complete len:177 (-) Transcript_42937:1113-1643(-)